MTATESSCAGTRSSSPTVIEVGVEGWGSDEESIRLEFVECRFSEVRDEEGVDNLADLLPAVNVGKFTVPAGIF